MKLPRWDKGKGPSYFELFDEYNLGRYELFEERFNQQETFKINKNLQSFIPTNYLEEVILKLNKIGNTIHYPGCFCYRTRRRERIELTLEEYLNNDKIKLCKELRKYGQLEALIGINGERLLSRYIHEITRSNFLDLAIKEFNKISGPKVEKELEFLLSIMTGLDKANIKNFNLLKNIPFNKSGELREFAEHYENKLSNIKKTLENQFTKKLSTYKDGYLVAQAHYGVAYYFKEVTKYLVQQKKKIREEYQAQILIAYSLILEKFIILPAELLPPLETLTNTLATDWSESQSPYNLNPENTLCDLGEVEDAWALYDRGGNSEYSKLDSVVKAIKALNKLDN